MGIVCSLWHSKHSMPQWAPELESRTQGSRPRTQKKIRGQGQPFRGQTLLRPRSSSVRRILKKGGGGAGTSKNLRSAKVGMNIVSPKFSSIFLPKLGEDEKKKVFSQI